MGEEHARGTDKSHLDGTEIRPKSAINIPHTIQTFNSFNHRRHLVALPPCPPTFITAQSLHPSTKAQVISCSQLLYPASRFNQLSLNHGHRPIRLRRLEVRTVLRRQGRGRGHHRGYAFPWRHRPSNPYRASSPSFKPTSSLLSSLIQRKERSSWGTIQRFNSLCKWRTPCLRV